MAGAGRQNRPIKVLIVDDTRAIRAIIRTVLCASPDFEVIGEAGDPYEAREKIRALNPDVITLDVEMPRMDGLAFLERLMRLRPMPVVMVSSQTTQNSDKAIRALSLGAFDCVDVTRLLQGHVTDSELAQTVRAAASSNQAGVQRTGQHVALPTGNPFDWNNKVALIGASTGGVEALMSVLSSYPVDGPPTVIAQHMPAPFLKSFTDRLDRKTAPRVRPATDGMMLEPGLVLVSRGGDEHVALSEDDPFRISLKPGTAQDQYVPSVDILFSSAEPHAKSVVGVMLTGMGRDGADAMARLFAGGARTIVQDSDTCVVDGMPGAVRALGAASEVVPLPEIGHRILASASRRERELT